MANKVYNLNGGLYSGDAFTAFETRIASSNNGSIVASPSDLKVSAGSGMNVTVATGAGIIGNGTLSGVRFAIDSPVTVAVNAASTANPRMDSVVAYIDKSVSASTSVVDNTDLGIVKFKSVAGTPASAPTAPSTATIQSSIGAGNPYMVLANITVPKSSSAASSFKIADMRVTPTSAIITDNSITTKKLANKAVTSDKVDWATLTYFAQNRSDVNVGTGETTVITINNLQSGTYLAFGVLSFNKTSNDAGDTFIGLKYDGKSERFCQISMSTSYGWVYPPAVGMTKITLTGNSVQLFAQRPSSIASMIAMKNGSLLLVKIG